ncbi:HEPN domain-containing protein [Streptosporangium sp. NPDC023615]|uniref:HEPN domain-containing protein n=1 Tax=Streptosporangium sp. NPDC023615 TaxID=3154794 RepID=UPI00342C880E
MPQRFSLLSRRITELRTYLLPTKFSPVGSYSDRIHERTRAFRVLAHAEFESFIEDRALQVVEEAFRVWKSGGAIRPSLLALLAYKETPYSPPTSILAPPQRRSPDLESRINAEKNSYSWYVRNKNHGIKEKNILKILLPIGCLEHEIDTTWLSNLDSWATARGTTAHQTGKIQVRIDPYHEHKTVREIHAGFRDIDKLLQTK